MNEIIIKEKYILEYIRNMLYSCSYAIKNIDDNSVYFVIGHKMQGYEKAIIDISKELNKKVKEL